VDNKTYTFDEAYKASLDYFTGDELAAKVWVNKYALKDAFGNIYEQSPSDMHHRRLPELKASIPIHFPKKNYSTCLTISSTLFLKEAL
jgi:hypothetical protein